MTFSTTRKTINLLFTRLLDLVPAMIISFIVVLLVNVFVNSNQGTNPNRLDELALRQKAQGNEKLSYWLTWLSARMHSPNAEMRMGKLLTRQAKIDEAWDYYFDAVYRFPALGYAAGAETLEYAASDEGVGMAASYLMWAAMSGDNAEAYRLLGYIALGRSPSISCERWWQAGKYFKAAAKRGNSHAQLIMSSIYGTKLTGSREPKAQLAYLFLAERSLNLSVSKFATTALRSLLQDIPMVYQNNGESSIAYTDEEKSRILLLQSLNLGRPKHDVLNMRSAIELPLICETPSATCNPFEELCDENGYPVHL